MAVEADKFINSVEKYVREFVLYLLSFFWGGRYDSENDPLLDSINKTFVFAIISATVGAYLWNRYIYGNSGTVHDLAALLTDTLLRWFSYGLLLFALLRAFRIRPHILLPMLAVFKVFSVAHVIAIFGSYLVKNTLWMFLHSSEYLQSGSRNAAIAAYLLQTTLIFLYMPREIAAIAGTAGRATRWMVTALFLLAVSLVVFANFLDPLAARQSHETIAGKADLAPGPAR
ncbi:hypothetical protein [Sandarakinorhabdus sp. DWP1-3-1]|uniref:hypothetical protein n=1 Tax=Sandarakinorhabdus sp. DWP1-3-1 TaxID=2804627 RepID=UPI003CEDDDE0